MTAVKLPKELKDEQATIFEIARVALSDERMKEEIGFELDLSEEACDGLLEQLNNYLDTNEK